MKKRKILAVLAHPDDESFGMGGTLALYAAQGVDVRLICATRGEAGSVDEAFLQGGISVAQLREGELRCAAAHLGLSDVHFLGYRDSGMPGMETNQHPEALINAPLEQVAHQVEAYISAFSPDVVLTFDPIGGYRHPDHIHIHQATVLAFERARLPGGQLYFHTIPRGLLRFAVRFLRLLGKDPSRWGRNSDIDLESLANVDFPAHVRIDYRSASEKKILASACHASQGGNAMRRGLVGWIFRLFGETDTFMRAQPPVPPGSRLQTDFFD